MRTIDFHGDKENNGRRSHVRPKQKGTNEMNNLFHNSLSFQNKHNTTVQNVATSQSDLDDVNQGRIIVIDKEQQKTYHPYTTKNKIYSNVDNKLAPVKAHYKDETETNAEYSGVSANIRSHRVNLFEN